MTQRLDNVVVEEHFMRPSADYPDGSYMRKVGGEIELATGHYATLHPDKPSLYWHGLAPVVLMDTTEWPWGTSKINE